MHRTTTRPIRILQVVHGLVPGGIETWLVNVLQAINRDRFQMDFLVSNPEPCFYDDKVRSLGAKIHFCPQPKKPWIYARSLLKLIRRENYDVVHVHLDHYCGFVLRVAQRAGVHQRIAHSHTDNSRTQAQAGFVRSLYLRGMKRWLRTSATLGLAVSREAGASLFPGWEDDPRWKLFYCGIDTDTFHRPKDSTARAKWGIRDNEIVIGHVGGYREPKNHGFLVDIAAKAVARNPNVRFILVGDGPLKPAIDEKIRQLGLDERIIRTGYQPDPREFLRDVVDQFIFPSLWEGLPLAVLEAQAAGLPCTISNRISPEVDVIHPLVTRLSVTDSAEDWANVLLQKVTAAKPSPAEALATIEASSFSMRTSVQALQEIYAAS